MAVDVIECDACSLVSSMVRCCIGEDEERVQRSRSPVDRERGERGISPIEWDQRSEQEHQEREARRESTPLMEPFPRFLIPQCNVQVTFA